VLRGGTRASEVFSKPWLAVLRTGLRKDGVQSAVRLTNRACEPVGRGGVLMAMEQGRGAEGVTWASAGEHCPAVLLSSSWAATRGSWPVVRPGLRSVAPAVKLTLEKCSGLNDS